MDENNPPIDDQRIDQKIMDMTSDRGSSASICPSEVARSLYPENWRAYMDRVRRRAYALHEAGDIVVTQKGKPVGSDHVKGPIRLKHNS